MGFLTELEETEAQELQRKLEVLNHLMDQETRGALGPSRTPQQTLMCECECECVGVRSIVSYERLVCPFSWCVERFG